MSTQTLSGEQLRELVAAALRRSGASAIAAASTARALVAAEIDGHTGHGVARVETYAAQLKVGKINGAAVPALETCAPSVLRVDARDGFAFPAVDVLFEPLVSAVRRQGVAAGTVVNTHHSGCLGLHAERFARKGLAALTMCNTPKGLVPWGANKAMLGTNPIAFSVPIPEREPLLVDTALTKVARGRIMLAARKKGGTIPQGWAVDKHGRPTTDPQAALTGGLLPVGGAKGSALAVMVEMFALLAGGTPATEASSLLDTLGPPPRLALLFIVLDPGPFGGEMFARRSAVLAGAFAAEKGVRLPGDARLLKRQRAGKTGIRIDSDLLAKLA